MADKEKARSGKEWGASFAAGALSGIFSTAVLQPFDVVKTHLQAQRKIQYGGSVADSQEQMISAARRRTTREVVLGIYNKEGLRGLWRGTAPSVLRVGLGAGLYFAMVDYFVSVLRAPDTTAALDPKLASIPTPLSDQIPPGGGDRKPSKQKPLPAYVTSGSGALARSVAAAMLCPITVVKTRMEYAAVTGNLYTGTWNAVYTISKTEGIRGLFSGLGPTLLRDAPYSALYLVMYDHARQILRDQVMPENTQQVIVNLCAGGIAGGASTFLTHPPDVVRTRLQLLEISGGATQRLVGGLPRATAYGTAIEIVKEEGVKGLFRGAVPRVLKRACQMACTWTIYEELLHMFTGRSIWGQR